VPPGGYLVGRHAAAGFEPVLRVDPAPPPLILTAAEAVSRAVRVGDRLPDVVLDAGVEPPLPWFVFRRAR
jgi:hypothetical protein